MPSPLIPVTLDLPDALIAELSLTAQAKGLTLEMWITILMKKAISELPADPATHAGESLSLAEAARTLTARETAGDTAFNAELFESEFVKAQATSGRRTS
ncbi:MAG: hypothetical protein ABIQ90_07255 [Polaromonas sp.]